MTKHLVSFGHGFSSRALARRLLAKGWRYTGTTRTEIKAKVMRQAGVTPILWPGQPVDEALSDATHILLSVSPVDGRDPVLEAVRGSLAREAHHIEWVGYLSTTGVYGDHQGAWVDETTPLTPSTRRGRDRVTAEAAWTAFASETGLPLHIFRLAGIYGPGRGPFAKVADGSARRIIKKDQVFSRIHVDDIAATLEASIAKPNPGAVYNVCDDLPAPPEDVIAYAAELLGYPVPPAVAFEDAEMTPMARSFYAESKRVRNDRIKDELGVTLTYPDYKTGLQALSENL